MEQQYADLQYPRSRWQNVYKMLNSYNKCLSRNALILM